MYQQEVIDEAGTARTPVPQYAQEYKRKPVDLRIGNEPETLAVDEKLCAELADVEANPLGELFLPEMSDVRKKRTKQLAFMLMIHTKNRAIQMITRLSDTVNGLEIWRRYLEVWEPLNRDRYRAMLMQLLQRPLKGSRGQALEECECPIRQYEAQNVDMLRDTIKAAILAHPQDSEWYRCVRLSATRLQEYDALKVFEKRMAKASAKARATAKAKAKGKRRRQREKLAQRQRKKKKQGQVEGRNIRHVEHEMLLLQGKGLSQVSEMAS